MILVGARGKLTGGGGGVAASADLTVNSLTVTTTASVGTDLTVTGAAGITGALSAASLNTVGDATIGGAASVTATLAAGATTLSGDLIMGAGRSVVLDPSTSVADCALQWGGDIDNGLRYQAANIWSLVGSGAKQLDIDLAGGGITVIQQFTANKAIYQLELGAAPAAAANYSAIWSADVAGKTQLNVRFGSGASQEIKIEA